MFTDWVLGVLFRPGATFDGARQNLRLGYWWILLSMLTLDAVPAIYGPSVPGAPPVSGQQMLLYVILFDLLLFDLQAGLLFLAGRAFGWRVTWVESLKYNGLCWSFLLIADVATFYPSLMGQYATALWGTIPFFLWQLFALAIGVKKLSGLPTWKTMAVSLLASLPWQAGLIWWGWLQLHT